MHDCRSKYEDRMECIHCGWTNKNPKIKRNCPNFKPIKSPNLNQKIFNFSKAVVKDVSTGMKRCTEEEIEERLNICKTCPYYQQVGDKGNCLACGCVISSRRIYLNKLAWKSQSCPIGKWGNTQT